MYADDPSLPVKHEIEKICHHHMNIEWRLNFKICELQIIYED